MPMTWLIVTGIVLLVVAIILLALVLWRGSRPGPAFPSVPGSALGADARVRDPGLAGESRGEPLGAQIAVLEQQVRLASEGQTAGLAALQDSFDRRLMGLAAQGGQDARDMQLVLGQRLEQMEGKITALQDAQMRGMERLRATNAEELERIRHSVDEKLQGTLERRLGESFKLVSDRLEQVQRGLGEMQNLATDVGGLKRVLTNVKTRGTWGEVQLERQLQDILTPQQYQENARIRPTSGERVEFAVVLPGRDSDSELLLPLDSKFPQEPYERLLSAQEAGDGEAIGAAVKQLERAVLEQARLIQTKYIHPPHSTDFAIMYLPTEGLFAEVVRIPGLASALQQEHRVLLTGPTTLMSLLNSLQMGFKTLAIEQRSSEVWEVLAAAKAEFVKYGEVWQKLGRQLQTAQNTVEEAGRRTRAVQRQLRDVEALPVLPGSEPDDERVD